MAYVYKHIRKDTNEVFYIGIGKANKRLNSHSDRNKYWHNIVKKCGFEAEIIEDGLSWEEACKREKYWISYYGRKDLNEGTLVNMTDGGEGTIGMIFSDDSKTKMRLSKTGDNNIYFGKTRATHSKWMKKNHPNRKTIIQYDINGNFIKEWESARLVYAELKIQYKNISACCNEKRKTAAGYIWKFKQSN